MLLENVLRQRKTQQSTISGNRGSNTIKKAKGISRVMDMMGKEESRITNYEKDQKNTQYT